MRFLITFVVFFTSLSFDVHAIVCRTFPPGFGPINDTSFTRHLSGGQTVPSVSEFVANRAKTINFDLTCGPANFSSTIPPGNPPNIRTTDGRRGEIYLFTDRYFYRGAVNECIEQNSRSSYVADSVGIYTTGFGCIVDSKRYLISFFNGVGNSEEETINSMIAIRKSIPSLSNYNVEFSFFYNQTGKDKPGGRVQDVAEVFYQRSLELRQIMDDQKTAGWDVINGVPARNSYFLEFIKSKFPDKYQSAFQAYVEAGSKLSGFLSESIKSQLPGGSQPPTQEDYNQHRKLLQNIAGKYDAILMVSHSQGNLFANEAFRFTKENLPMLNPTVLHVAPASSILSGAYLLTDIDIVINTLRLTGPVPANNIVLPLSGKDPSGHGFISTYMDTNRAARSKLISSYLQFLNK